MQGENIKLKQFLLGNLPENEAEEIDVQIITDESFEEKLVFAEEELIEDFLEDLLSEQEKELFFENFLTTGERVELFEETALLKKFAQTNFVKPEVETNEKKSGSFFEQLKRFLALNLRPIAAVLIILVVGAILWRVVFYDGGALNDLEKVYAGLNGNDLANPAFSEGLTNQSLIAGTFRDTDSAATLNAEKLTDKVFFRLALPSETRPEALFNLELIKAGQTVFKQTNLRVYQNQNGQELKVILPQSVLTKGTFQIKLSNGANYGFAVK